MLVYLFLSTDCFADITIARQGYPRMAISACFGGIIFSILLIKRTFLAVTSIFFIGDLQLSSAFMDLSTHTQTEHKCLFINFLSRPEHLYTSDMLFGVGLGCLLQMFKHHNFIMVCVIHHIFQFSLLFTDKCFHMIVCLKSFNPHKLFFT